MDDVTTRLDRLGRAVSGVAERLADPAALELSRRRFLAATPPPRARSRAARALAFAACLSLVVGLLLARRAVAPSAAVSFQVGATGEPGAVGAWIAATGGESLPLVFSEGTSVLLAPRTQVRVTETSARGAGLLIEQGQVEAVVMHASGETRWLVAAGPYQVRVTGTRFRASWSPSTETFELAMTEGSVVVTGPLLPSGRVFQAGERLRASSREGRLEVRTARTDGSEKPTDVVAAPPAVEAPPVEVAGAGAASSAGGNRAPGVAGEPAWRALFAAGKYKEAFAAVDRVGFAAEIERASTADLLSLADVARYGGRPADARAALLAARARGSKGRSAFLLGKVAADQQGSPGEAVSWFETYLREDPGGSLAEQALGRLLELKRSGDPASARAAAERYLAAYPRGAYSKLAQSLVAPVKVDPTEP